MTEAAPPHRSLRLVRGSHIVLPMPNPAEINAYTLQDEGERVVFALPWLDARFLVVGTTDVPHEGDPSDARCSDEEEAYLLDAYNRYFACANGAMTKKDIVYKWSGVRTLHDDDGANTAASRVSRSPTLASVGHGKGGFVTIYGGKLTTHRAMAEDVLDALRGLGLEMGGPWTKDVPLYGGTLSRSALSARAHDGPATVSPETRHRWVFTYGDKIEDLYARLEADPASAEEIAEGVTRAELEYAVEIEDAMTAEDFLLRRTKLHLLLDEADRNAVGQWFATP